MRLKLISCEIFAREVQAVQARSRNHVDVELLAKVPHQLSDSETVVYFQTLIDRAAAHYQAVLLVAGSCRQSLSGLEARAVPLVLPRAKDCISLLMAGADSPTAPETILKPIEADIQPERRGGTTLCHRAPRGRALPKALAHARLRPRSSFWSGSVQARFRPPIQEVGAGSRRLTVLEMLVDGYWNYSEFLVVPPGWRVVVNSPGGLLSAEEIAT